MCILAVSHEGSGSVGNALYSGARKRRKMKAMYPKLFFWQARKAGIPLDAAEVLWAEALRDATEECAMVESPKYWKSANEHMR
jgi:hypothetical protein